MNHHRNLTTTMLAIILATIFLLAGCRTTDKGWSDDQQKLMGTLGEIRVYHQDRSIGQEALLGAFQRIHEINKAFSVRHPESLISKANQAAGVSSVAVPDEVRFLLEVSLQQHQESNGLFHVGMGALQGLWGFYDGPPRTPTSDEIVMALDSTDLTSVQLSGNQVMIRDRGLRLDLETPMKGYALDEATRVLRDLGIESGLIVLGSDVYALGERPDGGSWQVWVKEPAAAGQQVIGYLEVSNLAVISVGYDVPYHFSDNTETQYHQILNPLTGRLVNNDLTNVIVVCDTGLEGSLHAITTYLLGLEDGHRYIESLPGVEALMITKDQVVYSTPGLSGMFHLTNVDAFTREVLVLQE